MFPYPYSFYNFLDTTIYLPPPLAILRDQLFTTLYPFAEQTRELIRLVAAFCVVCLMSS